MITLHGPGSATSGGLERGQAQAAPVSRRRAHAAALVDPPDHAQYAEPSPQDQPDPRRGSSIEHPPDGGSTAVDMRNAFNGSGRQASAVVAASLRYWCTEGDRRHLPRHRGGARSPGEPDVAAGEGPPARSSRADTGRARGSPAGGAHVGAGKHVSARVERDLRPAPESGVRADEDVEPCPTRAAWSRRSRRRAPRSPRATSAVRGDGLCPGCAPGCPPAWRPGRRGTGTCSSRASPRQSMVTPRAWVANARAACPAELRAPTTWTSRPCALERRGARRRRCHCPRGGCSNSCRSRAAATSRRRRG